MPFELFTRKSCRSQTEPRISISRQGQLHLNVACLDKHFEKIDFAQLLYDAEDRKIAIRPAKADDDHVYKLCRNKQRAAYVSGQAFLKTHGVSFDRTRAYPASWDEEVGATVIQLGKGR